MIKRMSYKILTILPSKICISEPMKSEVEAGHKVFCLCLKESIIMGAQWLSGRVLDSRPRGCGFESHRRHCVVVLEQDTFILA